LGVAHGRNRGLGQPNETDGLIATTQGADAVYAPPIANTITGSFATHHERSAIPNGRPHNLVAVACQGSDVGGEGAQRAGNGHTTGDVPFVAQPTPALAATLNSGGAGGGFRTEPGAHLVCGVIGGGGGPDDNDAQAQRLIVVPLDPPILAFSTKDSGQDVTVDLAPTVRAMGHDRSHANGGGAVAIHAPWGVRRLTPDECCVLQGFGADWNAWGIDAAGQVIILSDSARYRQCGNAAPVPVVRWMMGRLVPVLRAYWQEETP
jgi:hypothetical protein